MPEKNQFSEEIVQYADAAREVDDLFEGAKYDRVGDFMVNLAGQETLYGNLKPHRSEGGVPVSMSAYQIDPIKYADFLEKSQGGAAAERVNLVNTYLQDQGYGKDFDIRSMASVNKSGENQYSYSNVNEQLSQDPLVSSLLARSMLASDPSTMPSHLHNINPATGERDANTDQALLNEYKTWNEVPDDLLGQSGYWKKYWNTAAGAGKASQFEEKNQAYRSNINEEDDILDGLRTLDEVDFN